LARTAVEKWLARSVLRCLTFARLAWCKNELASRRYE
jgi:hypothetical protein